MLSTWIAYATRSMETFAKGTEMKLDTIAVITKGLCYVIMGGLTPLSTGLAQWVDSGEWPPRINWLIIIAGCFVGAATQMLAFLSQSFGQLQAAARTNGNGAPPVEPPKAP